MSVTERQQQFETAIRGLSQVSADAKVLTHFGVHNSARIIEGGMLIGVTNLQGYTEALFEGRAKTSPQFIFISSLIFPPSTEAYIAINVGTDTYKFNQGLLKLHYGIRQKDTKQEAPGPRNNLLKLYITDTGNIYFHQNARISLKADSSEGPLENSFLINIDSIFFSVWSAVPSDTSAVGRNIIREYLIELVGNNKVKELNNVWNEISPSKIIANHSTSLIPSTSTPTYLEQFLNLHVSDIQLPEISVSFTENQLPASSRYTSTTASTSTLLPISTEIDTRYAFRPRARLLVLLGDQLIGSARLALFELVKNSYDADATFANVELCNLNTADPYIIVTDDGIGMSFEDIRDIWLVPGADHKLFAKQNLVRSNLFGRLPLGEKGLGRFAVHKLGEHILLVSKRKGSDYECVVEINWAALIDNEFLSDAQVEVKKQPLNYFLKIPHGTYILISNLREKKWTRGDIRRAFRQITSICSPFSGPKDFRVTFNVPGHESDLEGIPSYEDILDRALWKFNFSIKNDGTFSWNYTFDNKLKGVPLEGRKKFINDKRLLIRSANRDLLGDSSISRDERVMVDSDFLTDIGPVSGEFYVFDRDKEVLARIPETQLIKLFLDENGGIRVYRDGVRVYNYGERGDDWLGLDLRRVNVPVSRISRNIIVGAIYLSQEHSRNLVEKTNREGFVESEALERLKRLVLGTLSVFEIERRQDKDRLRAILRTDKPAPAYTVSAEISKLRTLALEHGVLDIFEPTIKRIESEYQSFQETMLQAGLSGLGLAVIFHEVERGVRGFYKGLEAGLAADELKEQASALTKLFDGFAGLLRKNEREPVSLSELVTKARNLNLIRFRYHKVDLICPLLEGKERDFKVQASLSLLLGVLNNVFDNSFYWLRIRYPEENGFAPAHVRKIYVSAFQSDNNSVGLVIADNGPGFIDPPSTLVQPFVSRKPDGMGLGLYYANLVMELSRGTLQFPDPGEIGLPPEASGAAIALVFKTGEETK